VDSSKYQFKVNDLVVVTFSGTPAPIPHFEERIKKDGNITMQFIGTVKAAGRTADELQKEIQGRFVPIYYTRMTVAVELGAATVAPVVSAAGGLNERSLKASTNPIPAAASTMPPYSKATTADKPPDIATRPKPKAPSNFSKVFAWVLPGVSAMFLLFLASNAMTDLYREMRFRTFERYQTLRAQMLPFVASKVVFAMVFLLMCAVIMIGGGGLIFRVDWEQPVALAALVIGYSACAAGIMALFVALIPDERRAATLNSVIGMLMAFAGGCMFPVRSLPPFIRDHLTPLIPSYWFVDAARRLQDGEVVAWTWVVIKLILASIALVALAVAILQRRIQKGLRA
jgi:ABC-type multidrug transport system permease subunit